MLIDGVLCHRFASHTTLVFKFFYALVTIACLFFGGWGKWKVSARVKYEYPYSLSSLGVFLLVFFFHKRLISFSVEPTCLYFVYIV